MKTVYCNEVGFDCQAVVTADSEEEVLRQAAQHANAVHGIIVTPEMAEQIKTLIHNE